MLQIVAEILPSLEESKQDSRKVKSLLVMSLGEKVAEVVWASSDTMAIVGEIEAVRKDLDRPGTAAAAAHRSKLSTVARAAAKRTQEATKKNPTDWLQSLPEGIADIFSAEGEEKLASKIAEELFRSLRRRPTRRADIYDLFVDHYVGRGDSFARATSFHPELE